MKQRAWVFTLNNYSEDDISHLKNNDKLKTQLKYIVFGREEAPTTGTPHLQGYLYFFNAKKPKEVEKLLGGKAYISPARGNADTNRAYCAKCDDEFFERGDLPQQGKRNDICDLKELVNKGATMSEIIEVATSYQSLRTAELLMKYQKPRQRDKPTVKWYYGETGCGKTREAWEQLGYENTWCSGRNLKWWDGYSGQKNVIIDDFRGDFCTFHELLRILDRYPYRVEIKGSSMWLNADNIIITSCFHPREVYETREDIEQLLRRIDVILYFDQKNTEVAGNNRPRLVLKKNTCLL